MLHNGRAATVQYPQATVVDAQIGWLSSTSDQAFIDKKHVPIVGHFTRSNRNMGCSERPTNSTWTGLQLGEGVANSKIAPNLVEPPTETRNQEPPIWRFAIFGQDLRRAGLMVP